jgi:hypothetical protein
MMNTVAVARDVTETLQMPEMVKNIENFRLISENANKASTKIENMILQLKETGIFSEANDLFQSAKSTVNSIGGDGKGAAIIGADMLVMISSIKEMVISVTAAVDELKITSMSLTKLGKSHLPFSQKTLTKIQS